MRAAIYITAFIILSLGIAFTIRTTDIEHIRKSKGEKDKADIVVLNKWDVPEILKEISAISYLDENRFACVQDELGTIFIYNTALGKIEKQIPFAGPGDYEDLSIAGKTAYVLSAEGQIYQVKNFNGPKPETVKHKTHLTADQDSEGMCYDAKNNRLLIAIKGVEPSSDDYKGIYAFNLSNHQMASSPAFKINLNSEVFDKMKGKKSRYIRPSAIAIEPNTGDIYITEGVKPKLLILDSKGKAKSLHKLGSEFDQPEGLGFSPDGKLFISNEGKGDPGNIIQLQSLNLN